MSLRIRLLSLVLALAAAAPAVLWAQEDTLVNVFTARALEARLSGTVDFTGVYRNGRLLDLNPTLGIGALRTAAGIPGSSEWYVAPWVRLGLDTKFSEQVYGKVTLGNRKYQARSSTMSRALDNDNFGSSRRTVDILEANLTFKQFLMRPLNLTVGIQPFSVDLRGNGDAFFIDVGESEDAFWGANNGTTPNTLVTGGTSAYGLRGAGAPKANAADGTGPGATNGLANSQEAGGVRATYSMGSTTLDAFYFTLSEGRDQQNDRALYGAVGKLDLGAQGKLQALATVLTNESTTRVFTWGGGADYFLYKSDAGSMEAYTELLFQRGWYLRKAADLGMADVRQKGWGAYGGIRYDVKVHTLRPYFDVSYAELSGDKDGTDRENGDFVSLEDVDSTLIAEDNDFGLDLDANYRKAQLQVGLAWDIFADDRIQDEFSAQFQYAYLELSKSDQGEPEKIGDEIDLKLTWQYSENLNLFAGTAWLFDTYTLTPTSKKSLHVFFLGTGFKF